MSSHCAKRRVLLVVAVVIVMAALAASALAAKDYGADSFDVDASIQDDGSLWVTETVTFRFRGGPFTEVYRTIPGAETDGVLDVVATMDREVLADGSQPGQVAIESGRDVEVTWRLPETFDSTHTFGLSYRLAGAMRIRGDDVVLAYRPLPTEHDYPINSSVVRIAYPPSANLAGAPVLEAGDAEIAMRPSEIVLRSAGLGPDVYLQVVLPFTADSLPLEQPRWQAAAQLHNRYAPWLAGLALLIVVAGCAAMFVYWRRHGRDVRPEPLGDLRVVHPPIDRAPALSGMIKDDSAEAQWQHGLGTLIDLARRGSVEIEESLQTSRWRGERRDFVIRRKDAPSNLLPHESALLSLLFEDKKKGWQESIKMSDLAGKSSQWKTFSKPLQEDMLAAGLFSREREAVRAQIGYASMILFVVFVVGLFVAVALISRLGGWVMAVPFAVLAIDGVVFIAALSYSPQSDRAALERPRWQSFALFLKDVAKGKEPFVGSRLLEEYLPFAASFGLAEAWAKLYRDRAAGEAMFAWFRPLAEGGDGGAGFVAMIAASSSAASSASGAGGAGSAGGAAGGGASGAH